MKNFVAIARLRARIQQLSQTLRRNGTGWRNSRKWQGRMNQWLAMDLGDMAVQIRQWLVETGSARHVIVQDVRTWPIGLRSMVLGLVFVSILLGMGLTVWATSLQSLRHQQQEARLQEIRYLQIASEAALLDTRRDRVALLEERFGQLLALIPGELESVQVLEQIGRVARESGMQLQSYSPEPEIQGDAYVVHPVTVNLTGTFDAIGRFLEGISKLQHLITVDLKIESSVMVPGKLTLSARMKAYRGDPTKGPQLVTPAAGDAHAAR